MAAPSDDDTWSEARRAELKRAQAVTDWHRERAEFLDGGPGDEWSVAKKARAAYDFYIERGESHEVAEHAAQNGLNAPPHDPVPLDEPAGPAFEHTRTCVHDATVAIGALAVAGILLQEGNRLSALGWSGYWHSTGGSGLDFVLVVVTVPCVLWLLGVAASEAIRTRLRARTERRFQRQRRQQELAQQPDA